MRRIHSSSTPANSRLVSSMNTELILDSLIQLRRASKSQLARETNLSFPTVSKLIQELETSGLVIAVDDHHQTGGRPSTLYQFNPEVGTLIAGDVTSDLIKLVAIDFLGNEVTRSEVAVPNGPPSPSDVLKAIEGLSYKLTRPLKGICLSIPGLIDYTSGTVQRCLSLDWGRIPLGQMITDKFEVPAIIENDAIAAAIGEFYAGDGNRDSNETFAYIAISRGIGAGIVVNGRVLRGRRTQPGSIGHTIIDYSGKTICRCGNTGCLEALAGQAALVSTARKLGIVTSVEETAAVKEIVQQAEEGNPKAVELLQEAGSMFAIGINNLLLTIDGEKAVLGGTLALSSIFLDAVRSQLTRLNPILGRFVDVIPSTLYPNASLEGACFLARESLVYTTINGEE
ncbi:MAG: ROK family transcriptional regulator [Firmicutes bacterium]|nr:ROK family transcriptional regulator [Bacillota bacterium]